MASSEVRAPIVVRPNSSGRRVVLSLLAFLSFLACASIRHVAQASADERGSESSTSGQDFDERGEGSSVHDDSPHCRQKSDAPRVCELKALEPEDTEEEDAGPHTPFVSRTVYLAPIFRFSSQVLGVAPAVWMAQFLVSTSLARGPPLFARAFEGALRVERAADSAH